MAMLEVADLLLKGYSQLDSPRPYARAALEMVSVSKSGLEA